MNVLCFSCGHGYTGTYICPESSGIKLIMGAFVVYKLQLEVK